MAITIQKYGGSSLATDAQVAAVAGRIGEDHARGTALVVVVSARGETTDALVRDAGTLSADPCPRETDQLLATGELAAAALLAIALRECGVPAVSLSGCQAGVNATGRHGAGIVTAIDTGPVEEHLRQGTVVVVAGFQGLDEVGDVLTLGRGGSDTSAVAMAVALAASSCEIYTDVDGICTADPRVAQDARVLSVVDAASMAEMAFAGARVLHPRAVELATAHGIDIAVRNASGRGRGSTIRGSTIIGRSGGMLEGTGVVAVSHDRAAAQILVRTSRPGTLSGAGVLAALGERSVVLDAVAWWEAADGLRMTFCVPTDAVTEVGKVLGTLMVDGEMTIRNPAGKVSLIGTGLLSRPQLVASAVAALVDRGIAVDAVSCTEMRTAMVVPAERVDEAVVVMHRHFGLAEAEAEAEAAMASVPRTAGATASVPRVAVVANGPTAAENQAFGARLRLGRIDNHSDGRLMIVPLDHSVADGPITEDRSLDELVEELADAGVDAIVLHKGTARHIRPRRFATTSLILHLSASTAQALDPDAKYLVSSVDAALQLGADAVSVHVNVGSLEESQQIGDLARVAADCDRWNVPLLAMMYVRGPRVTNPHDAALIAHAATLAADMGADIVKVAHPGTTAELAEIVRGCPIPIVVAGGPMMDTTADLLDAVATMMAAGAAGVAIGRNIFGAPHPGDLARRVVDLVHARPGLHVAAALDAG